MTRLATLCLLLTGTACGTSTSGIAEGDTAVEDTPMSTQGLNSGAVDVEPGNPWSSR